MVSRVRQRPPRAGVSMRRDGGATAIEYGLLIALICLVVAAGVSVVSSRLTGTFTAVGEALTGEQAQTAVAAPPAAAQADPEPAGRRGELAAAAAVGAATALIAVTRPRARRRSRADAGWM